PKEGEQRLASRFGSVAPEGLLEASRIHHPSVGFVQQQRLGPAEDLLPAEAIDGDQEDVLRFHRGWSGPDRPEASKRDEAEAQGPRDHGTTGPRDHETTGPRDH